MPLPNETDLCRLMLATDHARADKARLALVVGFGGYGGATRLGLALSSTCGKIGRQAAPQQGNTLATGGRLAGFFLKGFCTVEEQARPKACGDGRRESRVHAAR